MYIIAIKIAAMPIAGVQFLHYEKCPGSSMPKWDARLEFSSKHTCIYSRFV
jgi:hypothetical protein